MAKKPENPLLKVKDISGLRAAVTAQFGEKAIVTGAEIPQIERISTGIPYVDWVLGGGARGRGIPYSRVTLIRGKESSAKSLLTALACAEVQRAQEFVVWGDVEATFAQEWHHQLGMNLDLTHVMQPENAEQTMDVLQTSVRVMNRGVVVLDSIAEMAPSADLKASYSEMSVGLAARLGNKFWRGISASMNTACKKGIPPALIAINQARIDIGASDSKFTRYTYPGGEGQKFAASIILETKRLKPLYYSRKTGVTDEYAANNEKDCEIVGATFQIYADKNKTAPPHRRAEFWMFLVHFEDPQTGFRCRPGQTNWGMQVLNMCLRRGLVEQSGAWYSYKGQNIGQGAAKSGAFLEENREVGDLLLKTFWDLEEQMLSGGDKYEPPPAADEAPAAPPPAPKKNKKPAAKKGAKK